MNKIESIVRVAEIEQFSVKQKLKKLHIIRVSARDSISENIGKTVRISFVKWETFSKLWDSILFPETEVEHTMKNFSFLFFFFRSLRQRIFWFISLLHETTLAISLRLALHCYSLRKLKRTPKQLWPGRAIFFLRSN